MSSPRSHAGAIVVLTTAMLAGCGVESAATAAAAGASKAKEAEQAKNTVADVRSRLATAQDKAAARTD